MLTSGFFPGNGERLVHTHTHAHRHTYTYAPIKNISFFQIYKPVEQLMRSFLPLNTSLELHIINLINKQIEQTQNGLNHQIKATQIQPNDSVPLGEPYSIKQ